LWFGWKKRIPRGLVFPADVRAGFILRKGSVRLARKNDGSSGSEFSRKKTSAAQPQPKEK